MILNSLKVLHISCAALSYTMFFMRGFWSWRNPGLLQQLWVKFTPHLIDTLLLGSAVAMAVKLHLSLFGASWLQGKIAALLLYIALGEIAIRYGKTIHIKLLAWLAAQCVFLYIVVTAVNHDPVPWHMLYP
ncbi:MAG: SirB2 family protein [Gallionella sp.]